MNYIGIDLHKKTISLCVMSKGRKVLCEKVLRCDNEAEIIEFFGRWTPFCAVVEATASYEWFVQLIEPLAKRVILAHPKKLRVIAETKNKTDRIDAHVLAEFLALDMIPQSYRPTPRLRAYRRLVRYRHFVRGRVTSVRCKIRHILSDYNLDRPNLFTAEGLEYLQGVEVSPADRWVLEQFVLQWQQHRSQVQAANKQLREFSKKIAVGRTRTPRSAPQYSDDWQRNVRCGTQRTGRRAAFSFAKEGGGLRRAGSGSAGVGGSAKRVAYHQGGVTAVALGPGGGGLAVGRQEPLLGIPLRTAESSDRSQKGDRGDSTAAVVRHGGDASKRTAVSPVGGVR